MASRSLDGVSSMLSTKRRALYCDGVTPPMGTHPQLPAQATLSLGRGVLALSTRGALLAPWHSRGATANTPPNLLKSHLPGGGALALCLQARRTLHPTRYPLSGPTIHALPGGFARLIARFGSVPGLAHVLVAAHPSR